VQVIADVESRWQIEGGIDQPLVDKAPGMSNNIHMIPLRVHSLLHMHSWIKARFLFLGAGGYASGAPSDGCDTATSCSAAHQEILDIP
jgi:hypothetical protein